MVFCGAEEKKTGFSVPGGKEKRRQVSLNERKKKKNRMIRPRTAQTKKTRETGVACRKTTLVAPDGPKKKRGEGKREPPAV